MNWQVSRVDGADFRDDYPCGARAGRLLGHRSLEEMSAALREAGILAAPSGYAGGHLCNHVFCYGSHLARTLAEPFLTGFLHVPPLPDPLQADWGAKKGLALERLVQAGGIVVGVVGRYLTDSRRT